MLVPSKESIHEHESVIKKYIIQNVNVGLQIKAVDSRNVWIVSLYQNSEKDLT